MGKSRKKEELNIPVMIICIIGSVLFVFGLLVLKNGDFKLNVISTQGTVTGTVSKKVGDEIQSKSVNIRYSANRSNYNATIENYSKDVNPGDKIILYYDLFTPESVSESRRGYVGYVATILGFIFVLKTGPRFIRIIRDNYL